MKNILLIFAIAAFLFLALLNVKAENNFITIDTVYNFSPGDGQNVGQSDLYYPENIFGPPFALADSTIPASAPNDLLSIGINGEIIVGFKNYKIVDKPGIDFIIYENVMYNKIMKRYFVEPAQVSVSEDGINYIAFPIDSVTLENCAGISPTIGKMINIDILQSGGDGFDIAKLGLKEIKYIKIKDVCDIIQNKEHYYWDPTISGFDLDAVVGIHYEPIKNSVYNNLTNESSINKYKIKELISKFPNYEFAIYDIRSKLIAKNILYKLNYTINQLEKGNYIISIYSDFNTKKNAIFIKINI